MLEENCNLAEDRISCLEGELRDVTLIADESALKFDEVAHLLPYNNLLMRNKTKFGSLINHFATTWKDGQRYLHI